MGQKTIKQVYSDVIQGNGSCFNYLLEMATPKNSEEDGERDLVIITLRTTVDSLKDKCIKLSTALDKALVSQRESQMQMLQMQQSHNNETAAAAAASQS